MEEEFDPIKKCKEECAEYYKPKSDEYYECIEECEALLYDYEDIEIEPEEMDYE